MRFEINRASQIYNTENKPHDKAFLDADKERWLIDIDTLEELVDLDECGVIVTPKQPDCDVPTITIYDSYVE